MRTQSLTAVLFAVLATACSAGREAIQKDEAFDSDMAVPDRTRELVLVANAHRDCDQEQIDCFAECWKSPPPWPYKRGDKSYGTYCANLCLKKYMRCIEELKSHPRRCTERFNGSMSTRQNSWWEPSSSSQERLLS